MAVTDAPRNCQKNYRVPNHRQLVLEYLKSSSPPGGVVSRRTASRHIGRRKSVALTLRLKALVCGVEVVELGGRLELEGWGEVGGGEQSNRVPHLSPLYMHKPAIFILPSAFDS